MQKLYTDCNVLFALNHLNFIIYHISIPKLLALAYLIKVYKSLTPHK